MNNIVSEININWILRYGSVLRLMGWVTFMTMIIEVYVMRLLLETVMLIIFSMFICVGICWFMMFVMSSLVHWFMVS